jgi:adenine-specific DNA-methyltransferase
MPAQQLPEGSLDIAAETLDQLRALVPHAFSSEGKLDVEKLKAALGEHVDVGRERYGLNWPGKAEAFRNVQGVSTGTLAPQPETSVRWDETENLIIEGDNLEVLKLLQRPYHGKVKMIYIDPPYNTGNEFIYPDNFREGLADYLRYSGQVSGEGMAQSTNKETSGRYHSNWLSMMMPRLFLARNLLREDGVIFVSIDDHEVHNLRHLMDEIFGEENFVANIVWQKRTSPDARLPLSDAHEFIVCFARCAESFDLKKLAQDEVQLKNFKNPDDDVRGVWASSDFTAQGFRPNQMYEIVLPSGRRVSPPQGNCWKTTQETFNALRADGRIWFGKDGNGVPRRKTFLVESEGVSAWTWWRNTEVGHSQEAKQELKDLLDDAGASFDTPKPVRLIRRMAELLTNETDLILDFFAGSGTTAQAVLELNAKDGGERKFILVQLPEKTENPKFPTIADITRERVRRVIAKMDAADADKAAQPQQASLAEAEATAAPQHAPKPRGFRAFKLAASNFKVWDETITDAVALTEQIELSADSLAPAYTELGLVYEIMLRAGRSVAEPVAALTIADFPHAKTYAVSGNALCICLAERIDLPLMCALLAKKPEALVCLDRSFHNDDALKKNAFLEAERCGVNIFYTE